MNQPPPPPRTQPADPIPVERVLVRVLVACRLGGLLLIVAAGIAAHTQPDTVPLVLALAAVMLAQSLAVVFALLRDRLTLTWLLVDIVLTAVELLIGASHTVPIGGHSWLQFSYLFSLVVAIEIGLRIQHPAAVAATTLVLILAYAYAAVHYQHDRIWIVMPNLIGYLGNTLIPWAIAHILLRMSRELAASRHGELARAAELAQERQRNRYARLLHDHVLQTLETLAHNDLVRDNEFRDHLRAEALWLRTFVTTGAPPQPGDLLAELNTVVLRKAQSGLTVEFNAAALTYAPHLRTHLPAATRAALLEATNEALTNVGKHAQVDHATLRVSTSPTHLLISVVDHGCGFQPDTVQDGLGLARSIHERMAEINGEARVDSAPGEGTCVELLIALPDQRTENHQSGALTNTGNTAGQ